MKRSGFLFVTLTVLVALIAAACGGGGDEEEGPSTQPTARPGGASPTAAPTATPALTPKTGGTLQARVALDWPLFDTWHNYGGYTTQFMMSVMSSLIRYKQDSVKDLEGDLATSWNVSADGKAVTFRLRNDAKWSDGKPVTSADVAYSLKRPNSGVPDITFNVGRVASIASIDTPDAGTVVTNLKTVSASFLSNMASPFMLMYPAHGDPSKFKTSAISSGPFQVKGYTKDVSYVFAKNPGYYGKDSAGRALPYLDGIQWNIIPDATSALSAFRTGRLDCGCGYDNDFLNEASDTLEKEIPGIKFHTNHGGLFMLQLNTTKPPWNNKTFRQAVMIGIDKEKVSQVWQRGRNYRPAPPLLPPEVGGAWGLPKAELEKIPGYNPNHAADVALSKAKFKESGVDPTTVSAAVLQHQYFIQLAEILATAIGELGLKVSSRSANNPEFQDFLGRGDYTIGHVSAGLSVDDPSDNWISMVKTGGFQNYTKLSNPKLDQLLDDQDKELDAAKRRQMLWEAQKISFDDAAAFSFIWQGAVNAVQPYVMGYVGPKITVASGFRLDGVWLNR